MKSLGSLVVDFGVTVSFDGRLMGVREGRVVDAVPLKFFWVPYGSFFARVSAMMAWSRKRGRSSPAEKKKEKRYGCGSKKKRCGCDSEEPPTCHCGAHRFKNEEHNRILEEWSYRRKISVMAKKIAVYLTFYF